MKAICQNHFFRVYSPDGVGIVIKSQGEGIGTDDSGDAVCVFPETVENGKYTPAVRFETNLKTL